MVVGSFYVGFIPGYLYSYGRRGKISLCSMNYKTRNPKQKYVNQPWYQNQGQNGHINSNFMFFFGQ